MTNWFLEDIEKAVQANPDSFFIPPKKERQKQTVGKHVKLHFVLANSGEKEPRAERMWVTISKVLALRQGYEGVLDNDPQYIKGLHAGDIIKFQSRHIAQILISRDDPRWVDGGDKIALVSRLVFEGDKTIRFLYHEKPDREQDSGWRLFTGQETDEYINNANNIRFCNIGWLVDFDPSLLEVFKNDRDVAFERKSRTSKWSKVEDWQPPQE